MISLINTFIKTMRHKLLLRRYDDFTISEYFKSLGAKVGGDCRISVRNLGNEPYLVTIGDHVSISSGVRFITHDGAVWLSQDENPKIQYFAPIIIGSNCYIGEEAMLLPGIKIGDNSIVAARAVVSKDVPAGTIVGGVPARIIGDVDRYLEKRKKQWVKLSPPDYMSNLPSKAGLKPAEIFAEKRLNANRMILREYLCRLFMRKME